ncbi:DUF397 domain-containing protein [Streptomyces sp. HC44]|uniref:DUF397 domain-containing protein n=1 Tax=Streptomyces scabichelini TaxID=2711217 RepID=A0A6G4VBK3_9ACTN|nr:DUF397 domain-containing protein [Streptomyces scabichelini]NGO11469.1 DUF397 domain-containing protein [Streptomyces scabichelini]
MNAAEPTPDCAFPWFKSSYSNGAGGECVECAHSVDGALVRDSKNANGPVVAVRAHAWQAFIRALRTAKPEG